MRQGKLLAASLLALVLLSGAYLAARFQGGAPIETDLLALLPVTEKHPLAERALAVASRAVGERAVFVLEAPRFEPAAAAAKRLGALLREHPAAFKTVVSEASAVDADLPSKVYQAHRGHILLPEDAEGLRRDSKGFLAARIEERLHAPLAFGPSTRLESDPFGFLQRHLARLPLGDQGLKLREGYFTAKQGDTAYVFVFAQPAGSPYQSEVQAAATAALASARSMLGREYPELRLAVTGAVFHGAAARAQAEGEMNRISGISLAVVLLMLWAVFRTGRHLWVGLLPIVCGLLVATAASLLFYERLHLLTLGCGATLIGVSIDYSLHFFALQLGQGQAWQAQHGARRLLPSLALGVLTTLAGYALLSVLPFPGLQQMALFSILGIAVAAATVVLWFPLLLHRPLARQTRGILRFPAAMLARAGPLYRSRVLVIGLPVLGLLALPGWLALDSKDDVRSLIATPPELAATDALLRDLASLGGGNQFFLVEASSGEELSARERDLQRALAGVQERGGLVRTQTVGQFVPPLAEQERAHQLLTGLWHNGQIPTVMREAGFTAAAIAGTGKALLESQALTRQAWLASPLGWQQRALALGETTSIVMPQGHRYVAPLREATRDLPGVTLIDKPGSVSMLFGQYRRLTVWVLLAVFPLAVLLLARRYRWRNALRIVAPAAAALAATLAVLGWMGEAMTLFHALGLLLVFGVGIDYGIFLFEDRAEDPAVFLGVLLAAATTLLSFGLLSLSAMPALRGFGLTIFLGIAFSALAAPGVLAGHQAGESRR